LEFGNIGWAVETRTMGLLGREKAWRYL